MTEMSQLQIVIIAMKVSNPEQRYVLFSLKMHYPTQFRQCAKRINKKFISGFLNETFTISNFDNVAKRTNR